MFQDIDKKNQTIKLDVTERQLSVTFSVEHPILNNSQKIKLQIKLLSICFIHHRC